MIRFPGVVSSAIVAMAMSLAGTAQAQNLLFPQKGNPIDAVTDPGPPVFEEEAEVGTLAIIVENDFFARSDQNYTNGLRLQYLRPKGRVSDLTDALGQYLLGVEDEGRMYEGVSIGQSIFTPLDITDPNPRPGEQPYAGWLYIEFAGIVDNVSSVDTVSATAGIVGPAAGGEFVQNTFHRIINSDRAEGWDNQLSNEPGLVLAFDRTWRVGRSLRQYGFDLLPSAGVSVGNVLTEGRAGFTMRFGPDLEDDLGPPRIRPSLAGAGFIAGKPDFNWYFFAGMQGRAVAKNIFLDGNNFADSLRVEKRNFVHDAQAGVVMNYQGFRLSYTLVRRSREFETQTDPHYFAAFSLTFRY
ncbi:lipid A deacylase LpxR family protein [Minwuia sp.]|uniref:lipid A deacylase LpxR family protein n=1 Tax=Minwuia sp. TaxID=2493630 RepID=UPI003A91F85C